MQRDYRFYIDQAKAKQGFKFDIDVEKSLGFKSSMISIITKPNSHKHLSEEKMMELAALAGISDIIALMDLQIMKNEGTPQQTAYKEILKRISLVLFAAFFVMQASPSLANGKEGMLQYGNDTVYYDNSIVRLGRLRLYGRKCLLLTIRCLTWCHGYRRSFCMAY